MTSIYNIHYLKHWKPELNDDDTYIYLVNEPVKKIDHILNSQYKEKQKWRACFPFPLPKFLSTRFNYFPRSSNKTYRNLTKRYETFRIKIVAWLVYFIIL